MQVDPITVEIIKGALKAAGREMGLLIERTAMSAFIREKKDFFAGMYDAQGRLVYTDHDKFGPGMVDCVLEVYPAASMAPGDVYWFSDCYLSRGAISHSPDMCFIAPAFDDATLTAVPDGSYAFADYVDSDCVSDTPFRVQVALTVHGDTVSVDFRDTDDQAGGPINFLLHPEAARMMVARFLSWKDPSVLLNHGAFEPITDVLLRPGSLVQPRYPASLGLRAHTLYRVLNSIMGNFAQATNGATPAGAGDYVIYMLRSLDTQSGTFTLLIDGIGVGQGARPFGDGLDVIYSARGQKNFPIEFIESEFPVQILTYAMHQDSGGPGQFRGGAGVVRDVRVLTSKATLGTRMNGVKCPSWGGKGGKAGKSGYFIANPGTPQERHIPPFGDNLELHYGDILRVVTSGGGGWGNPAERDPLAVLQDVKDGFVSVHSAGEDYGVVIEPETWKIDWRQTQECRAAMPSSPPLFDRGTFYEEMEAARR